MKDTFPWVVHDANQDMVYCFRCRRYPTFANRQIFLYIGCGSVEGIAEILLFITRQRNIIVAHYNLKKIIQILSTWNQLRQLFKEMWFK